MEAAIVSKNRGEGSISFFIYNLFTAKKYFILRPGNLQRNILGAGRKG